MSRTWKPTLLYAFAHFAVDFGCAYAMFAACCSHALGFLLYNFCAFAMQMPLGVLADSLGKNRGFALLGAALVALTCCLPSFGLAGCVILGIGNGLFHIGGGLDVLNLSGHSAAPLGVFVSPGAYGVYLGTLLGTKNIAPWPILGILVLAIAGMLLWNSAQMPVNVRFALPDKGILPWGILLFLVVVLRSYGGMAGSFPWKNGFWSFVAVTAVVLGKTLGGFLSDRTGPQHTAFWTLTTAALLFCFGKHAIPGTLALLLFNMTMPIALHALAQAMPGCKGFSFGILTFALFLGYLPGYLGSSSISPTAMSAVTIASAVLLLPGIRQLMKRL